MKTNLHKRFKTDKSLEMQGIECYLEDGVVFICKRFGGSNQVNVSKALAKYHTPHIAKIKAGTLTQEMLDEIDAKVFTEACVLNWRGVLDDAGKEIPFSFDACVEILKDMPELVSELIRQTSNFENYREDLGNF